LEAQINPNPGISQPPGLPGEKGEPWNPIPPRIREPIPLEEGGTTPRKPYGAKGISNWETTSPKKGRQKKAGGGLRETHSNVSPGGGKNSKAAR